MDLQLYQRVIWRFRLLVVAGLVLAMSLTLLSIVRLDFSGDGPTVVYRDGELWSSHSTLLITQTGFPQGRVVFDEVIPVGEGENTTYVPRFADANHYAQLAVLYSRYAMSDEVSGMLRRQRPRIRGLVLANPLINETSGSAIPMIDLSGNAASPEEATLLARRATRALQHFILREQEANGIATEKRAILQVVNEARGAKLMQGRSKIRPIFVFLTVMIAVIGLAFVLENLRPRVRPVAGDGAVAGDNLLAADSSRRSA
jgi:hypothetical protein